MGLFTQVFSLLADPPGNLVYHLVLVFSILGALQAAFSHWRLSGYPQALRTVIGLTILIIPQLILFIIGGIGWQGLVNLSVFLPPLDRAMSLIGLIWIIWLWAFPEPNRSIDAVTALLTLLTTTGLALGLVGWSGQTTGTFFNSTPQELVWQLVSLGFIAFGLGLLFIRQPNGWANGISVLFLALLGHVLHLAFGLRNGNYPGLVRLTYMAMYPFLMTLPQRFPIAQQKEPKPIKADTEEEEPSDQEQRPYSTDPKTLHALLALAAETDAEKVSHAITRGVAQTMLADLCFLIYLTDNKKQLVIASGYDLIREENLDGTSLNNNSIPMLTNAIQRGRPLRLPASSTSADIQGLGELLGLSNPGHIMAVPIITPEKDALGSILLLSPYSDRTWRAEDQAFLSNITSALVPVIQRDHHTPELEKIRKETEAIVQNARDRINELENQNQDLQAQFESQNLAAGKNPELEEKISSLLVVQDELQGQVEELQRENKSLQAATQASDAIASGDSELVESELRAALAQVASLQNELAETNQKLLSMNSGGQSEYSANQAEVIASVSQELRQPMSSIIGYTDLLLGESVGILGSLQRKFVERIKSSTERVGSLIDDMIQVTNLEVGLGDLKPEPVDLNSIIDNAMSYTSSQIREKNISLHLDLPKKTQPIFTDREALQQILIHLLQNAGAVSQVEGTITLKVQIRTEKDQEYVLLQVADSGGGIPEEDIPRVFSRLYRADNVLIQGVGDTGVGLSIAKRLTEAQKGRIWVESEEGVGSTFSVLLPMDKGE